MADADILIGPGRLYYAPVGEALPDETTIDFGEAWGGNWVDVGDFVEDSGITMTVPDELYKVYTEQAMAPRAGVRTRREPIIKCTLVEHTAANLALILQATATPTSAGAAQKAYTEIPFGAPSAIAYYAFGFEGFRKDASDDPQPVRYFLHRGSIALSGDVNFGKKKETGIPIEITAWWDSTQSSGEELGIIQIVTAPVTA